jgi:hypothetical protein
MLRACSEPVVETLTGASLNIDINHYPEDVLVILSTWELRAEFWRRWQDGQSARKKYCSQVPEDGAVIVSLNGVP